MALLPLTLAPSAFAAGDGDQIIIIIKLPPTDGDDTPIFRSPIIIPLEANVSAEGDIVTVSFPEDVGTVNASITNTTTGESVSYTVFGTGSTGLPFSGTSGAYELLITLSSGEQYQGTFFIQ